MDTSVIILAPDISIESFAISIKYLLLTDYLNRAFLRALAAKAAFIIVYGGKVVFNADSPVHTDFFA